MKDEKTGQGYTNMAPERLREVRERCADATRTVSDALAGWDNLSAAAVPRMAVALRGVVSILREDLPAAVAEVEHQAREIADGEAAFADMKDAQVKQLAEIERLTAELAAARTEIDEAVSASGAAGPVDLVPAIDRLREAACGLAVALAPWKYEGSIEGPGAHSVVEKHSALCLALWGENAPPLLQHEANGWQRRRAASREKHAPADASLEALRDLFTKLVHVDHMARHLCENSGIDHAKNPPEATVDVADLMALGGALDAVDPREEHDEGQRERLMSVLDACETSADASRPGLTEEQARRDFEAACREARARGGAYCITKLGEALSTLDAALRASRGEAGPATEPTRAERVAEAQRLRAEARAEAEACTVPMPADLLARYPRSADPPEPDRPTDLTSAMHAAQQRPSVPPDLGPGIGGAPIRIRPTVLTASAVEEWPEPELSGLTCPGCYAATGIAQPHDPRAALHEDDPERKTATLAGGGTGND